jgi:hypothetical protein
MKFLRGERKSILTDPVYYVSITNVLVTRIENLGLFPSIPCGTLKVHFSSLCNY